MAALPPGKFLHIPMKSIIKKTCQHAHISWWSGNFPDDLETFWMIWKLSGWSGNFPDGLETFRMIWKLSGWFGNFRIIWKLSGWSENFPDGLETFQMAWKFSDHLESVWIIWKLFGGSDNFPDGMKTYLPISIHKFLQKRIYVNVAKTIDALVLCFCRENDLCLPHLFTKEKLMNL